MAYAGKTATFALPMSGARRRPARLEHLDAVASLRGGAPAAGDALLDVGRPEWQVRVRDEAEAHHLFGGGGLTGGVEVL